MAAAWRCSPAPAARCGRARAASCRASGGARCAQGPLRVGFGVWGRSRVRHCVAAARSCAPAPDINIMSRACKDHRKHAHILVSWDNSTGQMHLLENLPAAAACDASNSLWPAATNQLKSYRCVSVPLCWHAQGVGLVWPTTIGRLEVNWCRVLAHQPTDVVRHGIEVGFSPITS